MSLNQEFGDRPLTPAGISGDLSIGYESGSRESQEALLAQRAHFDELVDRVHAGTATPDEEYQVLQHFAADRAHGLS